MRDDTSNGCVADYKCECFNSNKYDFTVIFASDSLLRVLGDCNHQPKWNHQVQASQYRFATIMFSFQCCPSVVKNGDVEKKKTSQKQQQQQTGYGCLPHFKTYTFIIVLAFCSHENSIETEVVKTMGFLKTYFTITERFFAR